MFCNLVTKVSSNFHTLHRVKQYASSGYTLKTNNSNLKINDTMKSSIWKCIR